jgi:hypothetical protein
MAGIDANIDDVQAGAEACSRAADTLNADTAKFNSLLKAPLLRSVVRHVKELQANVRDQRTALRELRNSVARLREELKVARRAGIRPPPAVVADPQRQ